MGPVQSATHRIARRYGLTRDQRHDLTGAVVLKLLQKDRRALGADGAARPGAFFHTVARRALLDQRARSWGRWRPSARARRLGALGVAFDRCVNRDGLAPREAVETLRARAEACPERLEKMALAIPQRPRRLFVDAAESLQDHEAPCRADQRVVDAERAAEAGRLAEVLQQLTGEIEPSDLELLRLRFRDGLSVRRIAERRGEPARPLYRKLERLLQQLRRGLEAEGLGRGGVMAILDSGHLDSGFLDSGFLDPGLLDPGTVDPGPVDPSPMNPGPPGVETLR
ncbi:MAG: sigma-70 family RNA polymerase sigma factor [Acidobacteriota bacterium]